jgi:hypothetical protein
LLEFLPKGTFEKNKFWHLHLKYFSMYQAHIILLSSWDKSFRQTLTHDQVKNIADLCANFANWLMGRNRWDIGMSLV